MAATPILRIRELSKSFAETDAVKVVSLDVQAGDCLALVGHNGAGKTTIFKMILGLLRPTAGEVLINGQVAGNHTAIGFLPESVSFQSSLTGYELLGFFARLRGVERATDFTKLLDKVDLAEAGNRRIGTYSKGMRQRLGLAQALIGDPPLLILDEPTSGLDPASRRRFYALLDELRATGTTILLSSHALSEVEAYTSHVAILRGGELLAKGPIQELAVDAGLPVRFDVQLQDGLDVSSLYLKHEISPKIGPDKNSLSFDVPEPLKIPVLHELSGQPSVVADIRVHPPTLDDIYAHFQENGNDAPGGCDAGDAGNVTRFPSDRKRKATR